MSSSPSYTVFAHLNVELTPLYRAILRHFVAERAHFVISLRPAEIVAALAANSDAPARAFQTDADGVAAALNQLRIWGNLDDTPDNADAATIEEFYQRRRLYQLSAAGEAAEQSLAAFDAWLIRPGELQTAALQDIAELLDALLPRLADVPLDDAKLHQILSALVSRFEQLAARAQSFMRSLHGTLELHGITTEAFLAYKERLIDYLEKFIGELVIATSRIAEALANLDQCGVGLALTAAARRDLVDTLDPTPEVVAQVERRWRDAWDGLRRWFIPGDTPSQGELLRARARSAIPALLTAVAQINERRASRADRAADFSTLARWFAEAPDTADCHRLWRVAFGLTPARHLRINSETLAARSAAPEHARLSWLEASPVWLAPRLRAKGFSTPRGTSPSVIDRSADKARLRELARQQAEQSERARQVLTAGGRRRLGDLGPLGDDSFRLFLDLLGHALTQPAGEDGVIDVESTDGSLRIVLEPVPSGGDVTLTTEQGRFHGRDHWITIEPTMR